MYNALNKMILYHMKNKSNTSFLHICCQQQNNKDGFDKKNTVKVVVYIYDQ